MNNFTKTLFFYFSVVFINTFCTIISHNAYAKWVHLKTEHFTIMIDQELSKTTGKYIASESERAYTQLKTVFSEFPKQRILIVVDHRTDVSNGSATNFPYPHITLYPTLPDTYSSIGEYKQWVYELVLHELVHYLSFYPVHGYYKPLRWILGSYISPNFIMLPSWWHEGLAVHLETHLTNGGRLRSANYREMTKALSSKLVSGEEDLPRINERYLPSYPYGQRPYFYGGLVMNQALQINSPKDLDQTVQAYSRTLIPYNIYSATKHNLKRSFVKSRKSLKSYQYPTDKRFSYFGEQTRWLNAETFLANHLNQNLFNVIVSYSLKDKLPTPKILITHRDLGRFEPSEDGSKIIYDAIAPYKNRYQTSDLFIYDMKEKTRKRLTNGARVREAHLSPDNKMAVAVGLEMAQTHLCFLNVLDQDPKCEKVYTPPIGTRISYPFFINNNEVVFIEKADNKKSELRTYNRQLKNFAPVNTSDFTEIYWAKPLKEPTTTFLMHALKKGEQDRQLFVLQNGQWKPITQDPVGLLSGDYRFGKLTTSRVTPKGPRTAWSQIDLNMNIIPSENPNATATPPYSLSERFINAENTNFTAIEVKEKPDTLWPYLLPHYWIPFIYPNYGGYSDHFLITLSTGSTDPLRRHSYSANIGQDTISNRLSGGFTYINYAYRHPWGLSLSQSESPLSDQLSRTYQRGLIFADLDLINLDRNFGGYNLRLGAEYNNATLENTTVNDITTAGLSAQFSYDDIAYLPADVAPRFGQYASISASHYFKGGDLLSYNYFEAYAEKYFSKYVAPRHTAWKLFGKALYSDEFLPSLLTPVNQSGYFASARYQRDFVIRGYPSGIFRANNGAFNVGLEFSFPILNVFQAPFEKLPVFFKRVHGSLIADYGQVDGLFYDGTDWVGTNLDKDFAGYGFEIHTDWTFFHYVPVRLSLGIFNPIHKIPGVAESSQIFFNFATPAIPN